MRRRVSLIMILLLAVLVIVALLAYAPVSAQSSTPTPTATFIPPTATPAPLDILCPTGTPAGWGTYTPSPLWMIDCGTCVVTPEPSVTATITPTPGVGTPTVTPVTPSPSPTSSAAHVITFNSYNAGQGTCEYLDYDISCGAYGDGGALRCDFDWTAREDSGYLYCEPVASLYLLRDGQYMYTGELYSHSEYSQSVSCGSTIRVAHPLDVYPAWDYSTTIGTVVRDDYNATQNWTNVTLLAMKQNDDCGNNASYKTVSGFAIYAPDALSLTPVPTAQPSFDTGYCSSVAPVVLDFGFDLFIGDGEANCDMGWEEFEIGTYTVPAVEICFQPVQVGVVRLFGTDYEVGSLFLAAAAAFFWRFFRTSS